MASPEYRNAEDWEEERTATPAKSDEMKYMDETHEDEHEPVGHQRYESLRRGTDPNEEEQENLNNQIVELSGDEMALDRLASVESGAFASESDCVDYNDNDDYLTPVQPYTEIVDRNIVTELSPSGAKTVKERQHVVRVPFLRSVFLLCALLVQVTFCLIRSNKIPLTDPVANDAVPLP